ncbi:MAG: glutamine amidotransferase [Planctomycetaceae bacterium]
MREWSSPYPAWVYLILAAGCIVLIGMARWTAISSRLRRWSLFVPRLIVLALLFGVLLNPVERREHRLPDQPAQVQFLVDSSRSMALEQPQSRSLQVQQAIQNVNSQLQQQANHPQVQLFRFGQQLSSAADLSQLQPIDNVTRLAEALEQLPSRFSRELPRGVVVFSDGVVDDSERLEEVAAAFRDIEVPIHVYPIGDSQLRGDVAIDELVVPPRVDAGVKAPIRGIVRGTGYGGERVVLQVRAADRPQLPPLATLPVTLSEMPQPFELIVEANPECGELVLEVPSLEGEVSDENNRVPFQLSKATRKLKVLYMEGTGASEFRWVRDALTEDKDIECVSLVADQQYVQRPRLLRVDDAYRGFPATREELLQFDCVICSDISIGAFTREQLDWTVELVDKQGGGFMMVGGITSFGAGGWDQTVWDQLIPVDMTGGRIGRGWLYHNFNVKIPEEALTHPIWKIVEDPAQNRRVLEAMPRFFGTNYMQRLKPAATILAVSATPIPQAGIMPIFACQSYGRGRTFAFAPDTTADWGRDFESQWGEGDNRYFRRFWRNAVRWLTENSLSGNRRLQIETDRVIYRAGQPIQITARAFDEQLRETIDYQIAAQAKSNATGTPAPITMSTPLVPTPQGTSYTGELDSLTLTSTTDADASAVLSSHEIEVIATDNGKEVSRSTTRVMVLPDLHELVQPRAKSDVLEHLASATGGTTLRGPAELASLLRNMRATPGDSVISRQPLWDSPWLAILIITLLAVEWALRRLSGYG